ncbi:MAG: hypothetical protein AB1345_00220 [Chloroflexota bacterium]
MSEQKQHHNRQNTILWGLFLATEAFISVLAFYQTVSTMQKIEVVFSFLSGWTVLFLVYIFSCLFAISSIVILWHWQSRFMNFIELLERPARFWCLAEILVAIAAYIIIGMAFSHSYFGLLLHGFWIRLALLWWVIFFSMFVIKKIGNEMTWSKTLIISIIATAVELQIISFLPQINNYPLSLDWSESSYIYYASLVASQKLYGLQLPMSIVYPSRALLDSLPFLLGSYPIWVHRLWTILLGIGITSTTSLILAFRLKISDRLIRWLFACLVFLYLFSGSVKYELQICIIVILLGVSARRPWRSLFSIVLASFWAGMSRLNWYPVPGLLAVVLYFLEEPIGSLRKKFHYLSKPAVWFTLGLATSILGSAFALRVTNSDWVTLFSFGFTPSYWYRLLPSPTYPLGVIPGIILISFPLWWLMVDVFGSFLHNWQPIRLIGLFLITLVLFAGGVFVSTKIGGGSDLHNLDAYLVCLMITGGYMAFNRFTFDTPACDPFKLTRWVVTLSVLIPLVFVIQGIQPISIYDYQAANRNIQTMQSRIVTAASQGEVLFINQRQLLTFQYIKGVVLVPDYELVELSAMVYTNNQPYLNRFHNDLKNHRFSMIVVKTQLEVYKSYSYGFGEENDIWVFRVTQPLLCDYRPKLTISELNMTLYVPRSGTDCNY